MDNSVEVEGEVCVCGVSAPSLGVLKDVQRAYEERLDLVDRVGGAKKLQMQVEVFRSWVSDLVGQNALLAKAVEELEAAATGKLLAERARHAETEVELRAELAALRRRLARKDSDLRGLVEVLRRLREFDYCTLEGIHFFEVTESDIFGTVQWRQKKLEQGDSRDNRRGFNKEAGARAPRHNYKPEKMKKICHSVKELKSINENLQKENIAKEREIRRLNKDVHQYEQAIGNLRAEISSCSYHPQDCAKKDAEVMVGPSSCAKLEGAPDAVNYGLMLMEDAARYQERIRKMEANLKSCGESVRALRKVNVALSEELHALRRVCAALDDQCRAGALKAQFKDEIIREMRRQLKQAKAKLKESGTASLKCSNDFVSGDHKLRPGAASAGSLGTLGTLGSLSRARCRNGHDAPLHPDSDDCRTPRLDGSGDDILSIRPN